MASTRLEQLDAKIADTIADWDLYTTLLAILLVILIAYPLLTWLEPDTHPFLLARQASTSPVRQPGESAVYRSLETPPGLPLRSGLNVKEPGVPKWASGKDGDLRDVWRQAIRGVESGEGSATHHKGKVFTVLGREEVVEYDLDDLTREINIIGRHIRDQDAKRVAIYLPNSVELLLSVFAAAFYGFSVILLPYNQPHDVLMNLLKRVGADLLVAQAGALPLAAVPESCPHLKHVVSVVEKGSRHMDFNQDIGGKIRVSVWHDLIESNRGGSSAVTPDYATGDPPLGLVTIWQNGEPADWQVAEFSHANLVSATAAIISSLPMRQRLTHSDLFLPADSLTNTYVLCHTFAAFFLNASIAINSVSSPGVDVDFAARGIAPTVIVTSAESALRLLSNSKSTSSSLQRLAHYTKTQALTSGAMPSDSWLRRVNPIARGAISATPGKLRLFFVSERLGAQSPPLSSKDLSDLRVFTGARVVYALTAAKVAGAVTQTNVHDYRVEERRGGKHSHFGAPLSSVEVKLADTASHKTRGDANPEGEIYVTGPAVAGGTVSLGVAGTFRDDLTLAYA